jgi:hypothetical protein
MEAKHLISIQGYQEKRIKRATNFHRTEIIYGFSVEDKYFFISSKASKTTPIMRKLYIKASQTIIIKKPQA